MSTVILKFILTAVVILATMATGYFCRQRGWLAERASKTLMTIVAVVGYPFTGFFTIWGTPLKGTDAMLPVMACIHVIIMTFLALFLCRIVTRERSEKGVLAVCAGLGNNGFTMGAFILYLLYGEQALGLANVYFVVFVPLSIILMYPIARHYAGDGPAGSLATLMRHSLLDWRSIGIPINILAIIISALKVPRPGWIGESHLVDFMVYAFTPMAFFAIGLRLHFSKLIPLWRFIVWLAGMRFVVGALVGLALAWLTHLTPWGFEGMRWNVYVIQAFVPTAVTSVAVANMFGLKPQEASILFVANTAMYLVLVLPVVFWCFGR